MSVNYLYIPSSKAPSLSGSAEASLEEEVRYRL
jgi:hypothetical protein